jgi:hypothetical protein
MPAVDFTTLRALAETMESIQTRCLASFNGASFLGPKIELAARFGHLLVRHLGLCQLVSWLVFLRVSVTLSDVKYDGFRVKL